MFQGLAPQVLEDFAKVAQLRKFPKGKLLHAEDDVAKFFYVIRSGWMKICHTTADGVEVVLAMQTAHSVVGEYAALEDGRHKNSAQVAEQVSLFCFPIGILEDYLKTDIRLANNMLNALVHCQRRNELQMIHYMLYSAPQRIGCFILKYIQPSRQVDGVQIELPYDKTLLAARLGMRGATFSRALKTLREETGVDITGAYVTIHSVQRLLDYVGDCYSQVYPIGSKHA